MLKNIDLVLMVAIDLDPFLFPKKKIKFKIEIKHPAVSHIPWEMWRLLWVEPVG
jgi:hypothetical protein